MSKISKRQAHCAQYMSECLAEFGSDIDPGEIVEHFLKDMLAIQAVVSSVDESEGKERLSKILGGVRDE